jgi:choline transport protein
LNAIMATIFVTSLLSLIILGSTIAFNIIMSVNQVGSLGSYIVAIACILRKRLYSEELLPSRFDLGRAGLPVNIIALCFLVVAFVLAFFPTAPHPNAASMNWTVLITGFTIGVALLYYYFRGQHTYLGPVEYVKKLS